MNRAELFLGRLATAHYPEWIWESLDYATLARGHGEPRLGGDTPGFDWAFVRRIYFDLDYHEFVLTQISAPGQGEWEFVLIYMTGENDWVPEAIYGWGDYCPGYAEAGEVVDSFLDLRHSGV